MKYRQTFSRRFFNGILYRTSMLSGILSCRAALDCSDLRRRQKETSPQECNGGGYQEIGRKMDFLNCWAFYFIVKSRFRNVKVSM